MKTKYKKTVKTVLVTFLALIVLYAATAVILKVCGIKNIWPFKEEKTETKDKYERLFNEEYPTHMLFWKNEVDLGRDLKTEKIENVTDLKIKLKEGNYSYKFILVIDIYDELEISDEEWDAIFESVDSGAELVYFGEKYLDKLWDKYNCGMGKIESDRAFVIYHEYAGGMMPVLGNWDTYAEEAYKGNKNVLRESVLDSMRYIISDNAKIKDYMVNHNA